MYPCKDRIFLVNTDSSQYYVCMYIDIVPNRQSPPALLLRESVRRGKTLRKGVILANGMEVYSFQTLLYSLGAVVRKACRRPAAPTTESTFMLDNHLNSPQQRPNELLKSIQV